MCTNLALNWHVLYSLSREIQRLLALHQDKMDMGLVREYFKIFDKENLLDEWLDNIKWR